MDHLLVIYFNFVLETQIYGNVYSWNLIQLKAFSLILCVDESLKHIRTNLLFKSNGV